MMYATSSGTKHKALLLLTRVGRFFHERGVTAHVVGGFIRDWLLGRDTADIDLALSADVLDFGPKLADTLGGRFVLLDSLNRIARIVLIDEKGLRWQLDLSTVEGSIEQDLARRDFTINAMAIDLKQLPELLTVLGTPGVPAARPPVLIDPFDGWSDLRQNVIRIFGEGCFTADPVRLLRAVRLAAELGFRIDERTETFIRRDSRLVSAVAGERVREELLRLLAVAGSGRLLLYLDRLGLLSVMFPELESTRGVEQLREHFWDVFEHSVRTVAAVEFLLREGTWEFGSEEVLAMVPWSEELAAHFDQEVSIGSTRRVLLKLASLLHDIAKPQTKTVEPSGRVRFLGHAREGATIAGGILDRLRFSTREIKLVETVIENHLRPGQMSQEGLPTRRAIYRYFRDTGDAGIDTLFLSLADHLATRGPQLDMSGWREHAELVAYVLAHQSQEETWPSKLVDGHDIINIFGVAPGPKVGEVLEAVREAQAAGELKTREEALALVNRLLAPSP
jgi:poly(A) polymerase